MEVVKPRVSTPVKRRLTTSLAADVESYTRLMREDEEATLRTLSEYREVIDGLIERHDGRMFSTAGDSVLAEFSSTVEAVRCAIAFQEEIAAYNTELPKKRRLKFRIGLNVGDVMAKGEALYGDGSMLPLVWRDWPIRAVSAYSPPPSSKLSTSFRWASRTWAPMKLKVSTNRSRSTGWCRVRYR
jgi:hypothetical protein